MIAISTTGSSSLAYQWRTASRFGQSNNYRSPSGELVFGNIRQKIQIKPKPLGFLKRRVIKKIDDVSSKPVFDPAPVIEIKRAHRIHLDLRVVTNRSAQLALEAERSLPDLCHGERNNAVSHTVRA